MQGAHQTKGVHFNVPYDNSSSTSKAADFNVLKDQSDTMQDHEAMPAVHHNISSTNQHQPPAIPATSDYNELLDNGTNANNKSVILVNQNNSQVVDLYDRDAEDAFSFVSSVQTIHTADGIADPTSFKVNCLVVFLGDMARGIFFPTMWNLVQKLDGDQVLLGYVIASFSFGRMLVLPMFGSWSNIYGYKWTLQISTSILFVGTLLFALVLPIGKAWYLIFANTVVGIGSGTLGVTMAYASEVTPKRKRTVYLAWVSAVQYAGTTATPFIGSLFVLLFAKGDDEENNR